MIYFKNPSVRKTVRAAVFVLIPTTAVLSIFFFKRNYALVSLLLAVLTLFFFFAGVEKKNLGTRRLVLTSILTAISVMGRFIPVFKPVTAVTVIAGVFIGAESGFTVGAFSALVSNFYFGQGPWTPFQMLSWGIIGFLSGIFSDIIKRSAPVRYIFAVISGILFSLIMDAWNTVYYEGELSLSIYAAAILTSLPFMVSYAASNVIFIAALFRPFGKKLERIKVKYGI